MESNGSSSNFLVLGAGVIGLTTALTLRQSYPDSSITIVAKHFPGDRSIEYTSPWAGANWATMANDNGPLEDYDRVTFKKFAEMVDNEGIGEEIGIGRMGMRAFFDSKIEETGLLSQGTGKVWFDKLVGGLTKVDERELPEGAAFGLDFKSTFRIHTQVYLNWLQVQALKQKIKTVRRHYPSLTALLADFPSTTLLLNCSALGSLHLSDVKDTNIYPTRGQTVLVAEPKVPIERMYLRSPKRVDPTVSYVFPRLNGGGVILGGSRQDGNWSADVDYELSESIMRKCCELCPELGRVEDLQVISHNVGLRPSRVGGTRVELESWGNGVLVVHNYGHAGAGFQSSWGTAERAVELVKKALKPEAKL
ncbi:nucleotide-binding domain-containing protein [Massarina eburnea CBS 473.64]|uniref:Nucleotide-binding domain-containing protein n=1 Tax=Massarina eburnea CBS 473.64 TaxID=1395130 RepID=A0A6A6RQ75_9PLEO|nr:nucleotide-binding domain-containing protein [Massarina eburnea CBS 473.64]